MFMNLSGKGGVVQRNTDLISVCDIETMNSVASLCSWRTSKGLPSHLGEHVSLQHS